MVDRHGRARRVAWVAAFLGCIAAGGSAAALTQQRVWVASLRAETDAPVYRAGEGAEGRAILHNDGSEPVFLPGCSQIALERETASGWESQGPEIICSWEGYAGKVAPGASASFTFATARDAGTWRVRFAAVSVGCRDGEPLSQANCADTANDVVTPPFLIEASDAPAGDMEHDTDRPGLDFASFELLRPDPSACRAACLVQKRCLAWTYVHPGVQGPNARCWLKSQVPQAVPHACCVSGVSPAAGPTQPTDPKSACEAAGGRWGPGGLSPEPLCFYPQPDAGKPCLRESDCNGHCLVGSTEHLPGTPGQCSSVEPMFGCFEYLDDQGRPAGICID